MRSEVSLSVQRINKAGVLFMKYECLCSKFLLGAFYSASVAAFFRILQNFKVLKTWKNSYSLNSRLQISKGEPAFWTMFYSLW